MYHHLYLLLLSRIFSKIKFKCLPIPRVPNIVDSRPFVTCSSLPSCSLSRLLRRHVRPALVVLDAAGEDLRHRHPRRHALLHVQVVS